MKNIQLKIVHSSAPTGSRRLCETCHHGLVLRGDGMQFTYCGYMRDYVAVSVEECSRFAGAAGAAEEDEVAVMLERYLL